MTSQEDSDLQNIKCGIKKNISLTFKTNRMRNMLEVEHSLNLHITHFLKIFYAEYILSFSIIVIVDIHSTYLVIFYQFPCPVISSILLLLDSIHKIAFHQAFRLQRKFLFLYNKCQHQSLVSLNNDRLIKNCFVNLNNNEQRI